MTNETHATGSFWRWAMAVQRASCGCPSTPTRAAKVFAAAGLDVAVLAAPGAALHRALHHLRALVDAVGPEEASP